MTGLAFINHYNIQFDLKLTDGEKLDVEEYLKSLPAAEESKKTKK